MRRLSFTPVSGSGGATPLSYSVSPALPAGLVLNASTGTISGTATAAAGPGSYTVTITDANGATATASFSLTVDSAVAAITAVTTTVLTQNHAAAFTPVTGTGGTAPLTYSVLPALPAGLSMAGGTGTISGTPTAASGPGSYTVTITDANGATATANFSLTVDSAVVAATAVASAALTQNHGATVFTPVTGSGGATPLSYSVSPALPAGLGMASGTGTISGTPTAASGLGSYTVTITDANGATATATFKLTVDSAVVASTAVATTVLTQNHAAAVFTPVTGTGGTTPLTYSVLPALPAGLGMASGTGAISGTPSVTAGPGSYTVTITDANGATGTASFSLTVDSAVAATTAVTTTVLTFDQAGGAFTPVSGRGGDQPLTYSVLPALPAGLSMAPSTGTISGTPTVPTGAASYSVTVTDANGATATAAFSLSVNPLTPTITWPAPAAITVGTALTTAQLDAAASANGTPVAGSYTYTPVLGTVPSAGVQTLSVQFTPTDRTDYTTATASVPLTVLTVPALTFTLIPAQAYSDPSFAVSATSASTGPVTYAVVSGPATVSGNLVTLTGVGTVVLTASQAASGLFTSATATTSFTVASGFSLGAANGAAGNAGGSITSATVIPGYAATYNLMMVPVGATYPNAVSFSVLPSSLPAGAIASFTPATIPANSAATPFTLSIQTINPQTAQQVAHRDRPFSGLPVAAVTLGFLLLPLARRKRLQKMPRLLLVLLVATLSMGGVLGLSGCGSGAGFFNQTAQSYTVTVIATDLKTNATVSTNVTLTVQ